MRRLICWIFGGHDWKVKPVICPWMPIWLDECRACGATRTSQTPWYYPQEWLYDR